jgi:hypothetical protein
MYIFGLKLSYSLSCADSINNENVNPKNEYL